MSSSGLNPQAIRQILAQNGVQIAEDRWALLERWADHLQVLNQQINLVSRADIERLWERHILHCLALLAVRQLHEGSEICDFGSGGGLPGMPLAIVRPDLHLVLLDSTQKKLNAVQIMLANLGLTNVELAIGRGEDLGKRPEYRARFRLVTARAVAPLTDLVKFTRDLRRSHAVLHAFKGGDLEEELKPLEGLKTLKHWEVSPLHLEGYSGLVEEQKKLVSLYFA